MLVLSRKFRESVFVGDEVKLTVLDIMDFDGQPILGSRVRLGFQCPEHVQIERAEYRQRRLGTISGGRRRRAAKLDGKNVEIATAIVRLQIQVPRRVPVDAHGARPVSLPPLATAGLNPSSDIAVHCFDCAVEDRIVICKSIHVRTLLVCQYEVATPACEPLEAADVG